MTLYFEEEGTVRLPLDCRALAEKAIEAALDYEHCPYEPEVSLLLTMNEEIHQINLDMRQIDRPTDVLSFPMNEFETPGDFDFLEDDMDAFSPESGELLLGDIVISKEKVLEQAEEFGHSPKREYVFLIVHSMLHLMGYDHMEDDERIVMEKKQNEIMEILNIPR
jgi:probable rRNA maturation factor